MDDGDTKSFLARDQVTRQNAPSTLRVANSASPRVRVDRHGKLDPLVENVPGQNLRKKYASRLAVGLAPRAIRHESPALKKYPAPRLRLQNSLCSTEEFLVFAHDLETAFKPHEITPGFSARTLQALQRFGAPTSSRHEFGAAFRGVPYAARHVDADNLEGGISRQQRFPGF